MAAVSPARRAEIHEADAEWLIGLARREAPAAPSPERYVRMLTDQLTAGTLAAAARRLNVATKGTRAELEERVVVALLPAVAS